jgi:glycyl-tRNA synthetase beta chain
LKNSSFETINESLFLTDEERNLYNAVKEIGKPESYVDYLQQLISLNSKIDNFFEKVLVMDKDEAVKNNRIALLTVIRRYYEKIADFSKIKSM